METWLSGGESDKGRDDLFIAVLGGSLRRSGNSGRRWWCGFNASVLAREGRRRDEALTKNEAEAASSSWLNGRKRDMMQQHGDIGHRSGGTS
jgi:hypothetical protein